MTPKQVPKNVISAWQKAVIELSRLSAKDKQDPDRSAVLRKLVRIEKASLMRLREAFTSEREELTYKLLSSKENLIAYLLGFHLSNSYRLLKTLERVEQRWQWSALSNTPAASLSIWDLGCGSGALSQLLTEKLAPAFASQRVYLYDTNSLLLSASKMIFENLALPNLRVFPRKVGLQDLNTNPHVFPDEVVVIGLGYVWNELIKNRKAQQKVHDLLRHFLEQEAQVMLILQEPAQDFASRAAMTFRDEVVKQGFIPLYPCPHHQACPMLQRDKDWCYSEFATDGMPHDARFVDEFLEIERTLIAGSSYVFASPKLHTRMNPHPERKPVVVGRPQHKDTPGFSYLLCNPDAQLSKLERAVIAGRGDVKWRGDESS